MSHNDTKFDALDQMAKDFIMEMAGAVTRIYDVLVSLTERVERLELKTK